MKADTQARGLRVKAGLVFSRLHENTAGCTLYSDCCTFGNSTRFYISIPPSSPPEIKHSDATRFAPMNYDLIGVREFG